jgi:hypothetical protein
MSPCRPAEIADVATTIATDAAINATVATIRAIC